MIAQQYERTNIYIVTLHDSLPEGHQLRTIIEQCSTRYKKAVQAREACQQTGERLRLYLADVQRRETISKTPTQQLHPPKSALEQLLGDAG